MKTMLALMVVLVLAGVAAAVDLGNRAPAKPVGDPTAPPPDPEVLRQGGDTIADAVRIPIPTIDLAGTTVGYGADYDEICPYGANAPDVVYSILPEIDMALDIDLCGSFYDTKVFVYDQDLVLVACNDDFYGGPPCGIYVSKIENLPVTGGSEYFIVVTGYGSEVGAYLLDVVAHVPCELECPPGAVLEGEPPVVNDYVDLYNGGCNVDCDDPLFQPITAPLFCGVSGHYLDEWVEVRETDWLIIEIPASGVLEITGDAERECYMFEIWPQDCHLMQVAQEVAVGPCAAATMTIAGEPGSPVWFWIGPSSFYSPDGSYPYAFDYLLELNVDVVAVQDHSWTAVRALFE